MSATTLADWPTGQPARLLRLHAPEGQSVLALQLSDLGFLPGEYLLPLHDAPMGGGARVVRIGHSTFALRAFEARCIEVEAWTAAATPASAADTPAGANGASA